MYADTIIDMQAIIDIMASPPGISPKKAFDSYTRRLGAPLSPKR